jgi:hypothetical protein
MRQCSNAAAAMVYCPNVLCTHDGDSCSTSATECFGADFKRVLWTVVAFVLHQPTTDACACLFCVLTLLTMCVCVLCTCFLHLADVGALQKHSKLMVGQLLNRPTPAHQKRFFRGQGSSSPAADEAGTAEAAAAAAAGEHVLPGQAAAAAADVEVSEVEQAPHTGTEESKQPQQQTQGSAASAA